MLDINFKKFIIFNSFYLCFCYGPQVCIGNSSFRICGFVPWCSGVRNITLLHTHIILSQHLINNFSLHTTLYSHATPSLTFVEFCSNTLTCVIVSSMFFMTGNRKFLHGTSLLCQGKSN